METVSKKNKNNNRIFGYTSLHDCPELFPTVQSPQVSANGMSQSGGRGEGLKRDDILQRLAAHVEVRGGSTDCKLLKRVSY